MANSIEHNVPAKITNLVRIQGQGYKIVQVVGTGVTDHYPSLDKDGKRMSCMDYSWEELLAAKVHKQRLTVRVLVEGNAISAERFITSFTGYDCRAISPEYVDIYVPIMGQKS